MSSVLFIGNSYTQAHHLPQMVSALAAVHDAPLETQMIARGGATLEAHWSSGEAVAAIRSRPWTHVVLQGQSQEPYLRFEAFARHAAMFHGEIKRAGAQTLLFLTWAPRKAPELQPLLNAAYERVAQQTSATVVPVGPAWERAAPHLPLYQPDGAHPAPAGSLLAAALITAAVIGQPLSHLPARLDAADGTTLISLPEAQVQALVAAAAASAFPR